MQLLFFFALFLGLALTVKPKQEQNNDFKFKSVEDYLNYLNNRTTTPFNYARPDYLDKEKYHLPSINDIINDKPQQEFSESDDESKNPPSNIPPSLSPPIGLGISQQ